MERDAELRVKGHLYEIGSVNDEVLESRQGYPSSERGYKRTLESVAREAEREQLDKVAAHIKETIREKEKRPTNSDIRRRARRVVSQAGYPADSHLNAV